MTSAAALDRGRVVLRPLRRPGAAPPLFLVSAPQVNALGYVALARCLAPGESPFALQGEGAGKRGREYEPDEVAELATAYLAVVRGRQPRGPYFFAGMCEGAHIAFEMARQLEAVGERVGLLVMLDTWPVENSSHYPLVMLESLRLRLARRSGRQAIARAARALWRSLRPLISPGLTVEPRPGSATAPPGREWREPREPRSDRERWRQRVWPGAAFVPPRIEAPIAVLRVQRQPYYRLRDASLGWRARTAGEVDVRVVPGEHGTLLRAPHVGEVARTLEACLREARAAEAACA